MRLELKFISVSLPKSRETYCFTARLNVDSVYVAEISNDGSGGADRVDIRPRRKALFETIDAYLKTLLPTTEGEAITLEMWCALEVARVVCRKDMIKLLQRHVLSIEDGELIAQKVKTGFDTREVCEAFHKKYPEKTYLNLLPEEEAFTLYFKLANPS